MYLKRHTVTITTTDAGAGTGYTDKVYGHIHSIQYVKPVSGGYADNVTLVAAGETTGIAVLSLAAGQMDASKTVSPRAPLHAAADGSALLYGAGGTAVTGKVALSGERLKLTIAAGGNATVGTFYVTVSGPTG